MTAYQGQPVLYTLNQGDVDTIKSRRTALGISGNSPSVGDVCPAFIVKLWNATYANLSVLLDGWDAYWATSKQYGHETGEWHWAGSSPDAEPAPAAGDAA